MAIRRKVKRTGCPLELLYPIGQLGFKNFPLEVVALPDGVISILNGKLWQRGRLAGGIGLVKRRQFSNEHPNGPSIRDNVMDGQHGNVILFSKSEERCPQYRAC